MFSRRSSRRRLPLSTSDDPSDGDWKGTTVRISVHGREGEDFVVEIVAGADVVTVAREGERVATVERRQLVRLLESPDFGHQVLGRGVLFSRPKLIGELRGLGDGFAFVRMKLDVAAARSFTQAEHDELRVLLGLAAAEVLG